MTRQESNTQTLDLNSTVVREAIEYWWEGCSFLQILKFFLFFIDLNFQSVPLILPYVGYLKHARFRIFFGACVPQGFFVFMVWGGGGVDLFQVIDHISPWLLRYPFCHTIRHGNCQVNSSFN